MPQTARAANTPPLTHRLLILGLMSLAGVVGAQQPAAPANPAPAASPAEAAPAAAPAAATPAPLPEKALNAPAAASAVPALDPKSEDGYRDQLRRLMVERKFSEALAVCDEMEKTFPGNSAVGYYRARAKESADRVNAPKTGGFTPFRGSAPGAGAAAPAAAGSSAAPATADQPPPAAPPEPKPAATPKPRPAAPPPAPSSVSIERPMSGKTIPLVIAAAGLVLIIVLALVMKQKKKQGGAVISSAPARAARAAAAPRAAAPPPPAPAPAAFDENPFGGGGFDFGETRVDTIEEGSVEMSAPRAAAPPRPAAPPPPPVNAMPELDFFDEPQTAKARPEPAPAPAGEASFNAFNLFGEENEESVDAKPKAAPKPAPVEENHDPISLDFEFGDPAPAPVKAPPKRPTESIDLPSISEAPISFESAIGGGAGTPRAPWEEDSSLPALETPGGFSAPPLVAGAPPPPAYGDANPFSFDLPDLPMMEAPPTGGSGHLKGPALDSFRGPEAFETIGGVSNPFPDLMGGPRIPPKPAAPPKNFNDETMEEPLAMFPPRKPSGPPVSAPPSGSVGGMIDETIILSKKDLANDPDIVPSGAPKPLIHHSSGDQPLQVFEGDGTIRLNAGAGGEDGFEHERQTGMAAFREARWEEAVYHLSVAASLRPDATDVKDQLRRARRMSKEQGA